MSDRPGGFPYDRAAAQELADSGYEYTRGFTSTVAGVTFRNQDGTSREMFIRQLREGQSLELGKVQVKGHPNAIGIFIGRGKQVGFIPKDLAAEMTDDFARGDRFLCYVDQLTGGTTDKPTRGVVVRIEHYRRNT